MIGWGELDDNCCLVSLDFSRDFDRVDGKYLMQLLLNMNNPSNLVRLIEKIDSKTMAQLNVNGCLSKEIRTERGVRQGCPLSAFLFIISSQMITKNQQTEGSHHTLMMHPFLSTKKLASLFTVIENLCRGT